MFFDDKTKGVITKGITLIVPEVDEDEEVYFKASFFVAGDLRCITKVTALFDLIVMGDIECKDIDVKGKLVCLGNCVVQNMIDVQNEIWANDIRASKIICHDRIVAQGIDADRVKADGNIVVGKTLAIEDRAETFQKILCGETAFGAGKLVANTIVTAEPLDMDDGEEALENPFVFKPECSSSTLFEDLQSFVSDNDYTGYFDALAVIENDDNRDKFDRARRVFEAMTSAFPDRISKFKDISLVLWLTEMIKSDYFLIWPQVSKWLDVMIDHFTNLINGKETILVDPKPADTLSEGNVVSHIKYGRGIVTEIDVEKTGKYANIIFDEYGEKKFPIPNSLQFFKILSEKAGMTSAELRNSIVCNIQGYDEWIVALTILNTNKVILGEELYNAIYDRLLSQIGLKTKFIHDRMREKGWE